MASPTETSQNTDTQVRDIVPPGSSVPGGRTYQGQLRTARRTTEVGMGRARNLIDSLEKVHRDVRTAHTTARAPYMADLAKASEAALRKVRPPSKVRYLSFISLSVAVDVWVSPWVTVAWVTVVGGIAATIVVGIGMAVAGRLVLGKHYKRAKSARKEYEGKTDELKKDVQQVREEFRSFQKWLGATSRRYPQFATRVTTVGARIGRSATKIRPVGKAVTWLARTSRVFKSGIVKQTNEAIPAWNVVPWWTIGAISAYIAHNAEYKQAQELLANYGSIKRDVIGAKDEMTRTRLAYLEREADDVVSMVAQGGTAVRATA